MMYNKVINNEKVSNMINYNSLMKRFEEVAPRIPEDRQLDWLENAEQIIGADLDKRKRFRSSDEREKEIERRMYAEISKLRGFSNSDIGPLYLNFVGQYSYRTAEEIVREKLCSKHPDPVSGNVLRFIKNRDEAEEAFLINRASDKLRPLDYESGAIEATDPSNKKAISAVKQGMTKEQFALNEMFGEWEDTPWDEHPWVRKNLSSSLYIDKNGELWLVKYACPANSDIVQSMQDSIPDNYKAQLCLDKLKLEEAFARLGEKLEIEHFVVAPLDPNDYLSYPVEFDIDPAMEASVLEAGDNYWDNVLEQKIPKFVSGYKFEYVHEVPEALGNLNAVFIYAKKMESQAKQLAESTKNQIEEHAARFGIETTEEGFKTRFAGVDLSTGKKLRVNDEKVKDAFIARGGDINDDKFWDVKIALRVTEMKKFLKEKGIAPESFYVSGTKKTDPDLLLACYLEAGGEENDDRYFKITRKLKMDLVRMAFSLDGGDLNSEEVTDANITSTISVIRKKETGHNPFIDDIGEIANEIFTEGLNYMSEAVEQHIKSTKPDSKPHEVYKDGSKISHETEDLVVDIKANINEIKQKVENTSHLPVQDPLNTPAVDDELGYF